MIGNFGAKLDIQRVFKCSYRFQRVIPAQKKADTFLLFMMPPYGTYNEFNTDKRAQEIAYWDVSRMRPGKQKDL